MTFQEYLKRSACSEPDGTIPPEEVPTIQWGTEGLLDIDSCKLSNCPYVGVEDDFTEIPQYTYCSDNEGDCTVYRCEVRLHVRMCPKRDEIKASGKVSTQGCERFEAFITHLKQMCFYVDELYCSEDTFRCLRFNPDLLKQHLDPETKGLKQVLSFYIEYCRCTSKGTLIDASGNEIDDINAP